MTPVPISCHETPGGKVKAAVHNFHANTIYHNHTKILKAELALGVVSH